MQQLKNSGFEEGTTIPNFWGRYSTGVKQRYLYPENGRTGGKSVAIKYLTRETGKVAMWTQNVKIDRTKTYTLSGWLRTQAIVGSGSSIRVDWKDTNGKYLGTSTIINRQNGTIPWKYFEGTVTPKIGAVSATIGLDLYDCSGEVWFDDISFSDIIQVIKYKCNNGQCVEDTSGKYDSLEECQKDLKYACVNNKCVVVCPDYNGEKYDSLEECQKGLKYACVNNKCVVVCPDYNGEKYDSLEECQKGLKYACVNNKCVVVCPDYNGEKYDSLEECQASCRQLPPQGYNLVWNDEFEGSSLNPDKWYQRGDPNSAFVQNGNLFLRLKVVNGKVSRGYINSTYKYKYGFIEIKAKVSQKLGVDNQFWLTALGWKFEMDVAEYVPRRKQYSMNIMYKDSYGGMHWNGNNVFGDLDTNYHLFQFLWDTDRYVFYRDGIEVWRVTDARFIANLEAKIELCLCGTYGYAGCPVQGVKDRITDLTGLPTDFIIDYVRIYQK